MLQVVRDLKTLAIALQPAGACTAAEREALTVASAKASLSWHAKWQRAQSALKQVRCVHCDAIESSATDMLAHATLTDSS